MDAINIATKLVNIVYTVLYFIIISRIIFSFIHINRSGFYDFIMKSSEMILASFRGFNKNNSLIDFSPVFALLALMLAKSVLLAVIIYLPLGNMTGLTAALMIALIDLVDLVLGFYLAVVCVYYFIRVRISKLIHSNFPFTGGFSPDRLLFVLGNWCNPILIPIKNSMPESFKKYAELLLIFLIIIVKLLLKFTISSLSVHLF